MLTPEIVDQLAQYWRAVDVPCEKATLRGVLAGSEIASLWETVGMPAQDWWLFSFEFPVAPASGDDDVLFGSVGDWRLYCRLTDSWCFEMDLHGVRRPVNSSITAFAQVLTLWDRAYRRIQKECPGDTGEDWLRGDAIVAEMRDAMRAVDRYAFENDSYFWPTLISEMAE